MNNHPFSKLGGRSASHVIIGELPYYRAAPERWASILADLKAGGIDVVSFYVPWRFHEVEPGAYDFCGYSDPQKNVVGFLNLIKQAGLAALIKPGPFIHAEVQLGGLPDRLGDENFVRPYAANGKQKLQSQGKPLPCPQDPIFRSEVDAWLSAVAEALINPFATPGGPVVGVQIGNEGIVGEAGRPVSYADLSGHVDVGVNGKMSVADAASSVIVEQWNRIARHMPSDIVRIVNVPIVRIGGAGEDATFGSWLSRMSAFKDTNFHIGHTEWVGDASSEASALIAHIIEIVAGESDQVEGNWGFTWATGRFADGSTPLFHSLLALMLGSKLISVYTACATQTWDYTIDLDPRGVIADGSDPALYDPPYCPGAPFNEDGSTNANVTALRALADFLVIHGSLFTSTELAPDLDVLIDQTTMHAAALGGLECDELNKLCDLIGRALLQDQVHVAIRLKKCGGGSVVDWAHSADTGEVERRVIGLRQRHFRSAHSRTICLRRIGDQVELIGLFNCCDSEDIAIVQRNDELKEYYIPAHTAFILKLEDGEFTTIFSSRNSRHEKDDGLEEIFQ